VREEDLRKLEDPYPETGDDETAFAKALGADCEKMHGLANAIARDLDPIDFGIGWWASGSLDLHRRILIGDYLVSVSRAVETNMVEARLHLLEAEDAWSRQSGSIRTSLRTTGSAVTKPDCPADELLFYLGPFNAAGVIRALASAMDCLAGVIIGTTGIPLNIVRADWRHISQFSFKSSSGALGAQQLVIKSANDAIQDAGPLGWLDWLLSMRNMLVHRGRRLVTYNIRPLGGGKLTIAVQSESDALVAEYLLPNDPQSTDADVWRLLGPDQSLLTEPAVLTLGGCLRSVKFVVESVAEAATFLWESRRASPTIIDQPEMQWPIIAPPNSTIFSGYSPGASPVAPGSIESGAEFVNRLIAAGVTGANRKTVWP